MNKHKIGKGVPEPGIGSQSVLKQSHFDSYNF